jgi:CubicO group peptidase (beta-lactamase class C family)
LLLMSSCAAAADTGPAAAPAAAMPPQQEARMFSADFDAFLTASLARLGTVPGMSVAVARSSGPIYVKGFGHADLERNLAATPHTRFYIASSTKAFLGLAMALLEKKGIIRLDWTLAQLAPDVRFAPELRANQVTLRHLLSHTHGLSGQGIEFRLAYSGEHDPAALWALLPTLTPDREAPLGAFRYSNLGYNLAAMLVERRLGRRWQDIVEQEVLKPLGMRETLVQGLDRARASQPFAAPYYGAGPAGPERISLVKADRTMQSAGGMYASANDLARWVALQLAAEKGMSRGLPADVVAMTHRPIATLDRPTGPFNRTGYGLGWYSGAYDGEMLYHAFGGFPGARAHVSFLPARDVGVAIVSNDEGAGRIFPDIAAVYSYEWFVNGRDTAARKAGALMDRLVAESARQTQAIAADRQKRALRPWLLTLPRAVYAGRYCNPAFGTIAVTVQGERIDVAMGLLHATATPFTRPDSVRVELIPYDGTALQFEVAGQSATALQAFDARFQRCG